MIIIIDANVIVSDPMLKDSTWDAIDEARLDDERVRVLVPKIAVDEAVATYKRFRLATSIEISRVSRRASRTVKELLVAASDAASEEGDAYNDLLADRLAIRGVEILPVPSVSHEVVASRAVARTRPFSDSGSGYRDTLHWFSVLGVVADHYESSDIIFVSADAEAFGGSGDKQTPSLHEDLQEDLRAHAAVAPYFAWARALREVKVPGRYMEPTPPRLQGLFSGAEVASHVLSHLQSRDNLAFDLMEVGLPFSPLSFLLVGLQEASATRVEVRQFYKSLEVRVDFTVEIEAEFASRSVVDTQGQVVISERRTLRPITVSGHVEVDWRTEALETVRLEAASAFSLRGVESDGVPGQHGGV